MQNEKVKQPGRDPRALNSVKDAAPATVQIHMRITPERKKRYVIQARAEGLKLSEWIQRHMDAVCDATGP